MYHYNFESLFKSIRKQAPRASQKIASFDYVSTWLSTKTEPLQKALPLNMFGQKQAKHKPKSGNTKLRTLPNPGSSTKTEL